MLISAAPSIITASTEGDLSIMTDNDSKHFVRSSDFLDEGFHFGMIMVESVEFHT